MIAYKPARHLLTLCITRLSCRSYQDYADHVGSYVATQPSRIAYIVNVVIAVAIGHVCVVGKHSWLFIECHYVSRKR